MIKKALAMRSRERARLPRQSAAPTTAILAGAACVGLLTAGCIDGLSDDSDRLAHEISFAANDGGDALPIGEYDPDLGIATLFANFEDRLSYPRLSFDVGDRSVVFESAEVALEWHELDLPLGVELDVRADHGESDLEASAAGVIVVSEIGNPRSPDSPLEAAGVRGPRIGSCHKGRARSSNVITPPAHVTEKYLSTFISTNYDRHGRVIVCYRYEERVLQWLPAAIAPARNFRWVGVTRRKWRNCTSTYHSV